MTVKQVEISELIPYENNPRKNDEAVEYVANSIREFGFKVPIVIDKENVIVAGHTRYKAANELGLNVVPCIVADDLDENQIKAFRLADNKVSEFSQWDWVKLEKELEKLEGKDMSEYAFEIYADEDDFDISTLYEDSNTESKKKMVICPFCGTEQEKQ